MDHGRVNLLHISDLHYNKGSDHEQKIVYETFFHDLRSSIQDTCKPDLIVFSGDLVRDGDDQESFELAWEKIISPILHETALSEDRIFLVPGNHDVQRSVISDRESEQDSLERKLSDRDSLNRFYVRNPHYEFVRQKLGNFIGLKTKVRNGSIIHSDLFCDACYVRELDIGLACINTAWMSRGGLATKDDRQRLLVPESSVRSALGALPDTKIKILVGHHPLDWLAEYVQQDVRRILERGFSMYLHGHMHEPISANVRSTLGRVLMHQSGALYTDRRRYNGYAVITISPAYGHAQVNLRSFYERREQFDAAIDVVPDGCWHSSEAARAFFKRVPEPPNDAMVARWVSEHLAPALVETLDEGFGDRPVSKTFVPPKLSKRSREATTPDAEEFAEHEMCPFTELTSGSDNFLIVARPEFGKTTLLRQVALEMVRDPSQCQSPCAPCVVEFSDIRPGRNRFLRLLGAQFVDTDGYPFTFNDLVKHGHLVVLVDDVDLRDQKRMGILLRFMEECPKNRFILAANAHVMDEFDLATSLDVAVPFNVVHMEPFGRREMRALVERWEFRAVAPDKESVLDRLVTDIVHINVPLTPVNGTILLTIFDGQGDFSPINRAVLIETFVETLLEKSSLREALRARFDFRNKVHLLSHLAAYMAIEDRYRIEYDQIIGVTRDYFQKVGLPEQSREQIDHFISAKILEYKDGKVGFRYRAFLEYFIAVQMEESVDFKEWVLSEEKYLSFGNEIGYYAGIRRSDVALLELVGRRFNELGRKLEDDTGWTKDLSTISRIEPPHEKELKSSFFDGIERQLEAPPLSAEERDEVLEAEMPEDVGGRQEVFRPLYEETGEQWTATLLLYSDLVKNSELVPDSIKRTHLARVFEGWAQFTYHALLLVPALVKHRRVVVNGVSYQVLFPSSWSEMEVARELYLATPRAISDLIRFHLGTEKLEVQLREPRLEEADEALILKFYRCGLYGDLKLTGFVDALKGLGATLKDSRYLSLAYVSKLRQMLVRLSLSREEDAEMRKILAGSLVGLLAGNPFERRRRASKETQRLERQGLVRQLRIQARERGEKSEKAECSGKKS